jgi:hypothetical protein
MAADELGCRREDFAINPNFAQKIFFLENGI